MSTSIPIGRILRGDATKCMVGCQVKQADIPAMGEMVYMPVQENERVYGIISNILVDDDGLIRQLVTSDEISDAIIQDSKFNRNVPLEMEITFIGHTKQTQITYLLPPRPPFSLDRMMSCSAEEIIAFFSAGTFGYFRHILRDQSPYVEEILAAHLRLVQQTAGEVLPNHWLHDAINEIIFLLRDDYPALMKVLSALSDADLMINIPAGGSHVS